VFGRRLWLPEIRSSQCRPPPGRRARRDQRADAGHRRRPDQAGDDRRAGWLDAPQLRSLLILQVHDELVLEVPEDELDAVRANFRS
jgi:DNA polymerase-1